MTIVISSVVPMARLSPSDFGQALDFLREAEDVTGDDPFPTRLLDRLRTLIPSDAVSWHEWSFAGGREHVCFFSAREPADTAVVWEIYPRYRHQDPLSGGCEGADPPSPMTVGRALKFSDFLSTREFRRLDLHADVCRPLGIDYVMKLSLPSRDGVAHAFVFDRSSCDFTERDRLMLDLLLPHFVALRTAAHNRRVLAALGANEHSPRCVVVVRGEGMIDFAGSDARRLLRRYFGSRGGGLLPDELQSWLRRDCGRLHTTDVFPTPSRPLTFDVDGGRLVVQRVGRMLLMHEEIANLTPRELQILDLVAEGNSNTEIAERLYISPGTVRIHLQRVYKKLGVRSRTAALARVRKNHSSH
jgi:DNA-binding CsgD family transcriptional regulator